MQTQVKWTVEDYHRMIAAGILENRKVELLAGEICQMPSEGPPHSYFGGSLADQFRNRLGYRALVRNANPITLSNSEPEPDIAVVRGTWDTYRYCHPNAEDVFLIVEVSETSLQKDLTVKRAVYATAGIKDYWILDLKGSQLIVFRDPQEGEYRSEERLQQGEISPLAFPDLTFSVSQLLA